MLVAADSSVAPKFIQPRHFRMWTPQAGGYRVPLTLHVDDSEVRVACIGRGAWDRPFAALGPETPGRVKRSSQRVLASDPCVYRGVAVLDWGGNSGRIGS